MTRTIEIAAAADLGSWTDITDRVDRTRWKVGARAFNGESETGGFNFADDPAAMTLPSHRVVRITEDATASPTVIGWGRVETRDTGRGEVFSGDARAFDVNLIDVNGEMRGIVAVGWSRPAETAEARFRALVAAYCSGSWRASTVLDGTTYVPLTNTTAMPAKKYTASVIDILAELQAKTGKLWFVTIDLEAWFDIPTSTSYESSISISDQGDDDGETIFAPIFDAPGKSTSGDELVSGGAATYASAGVVTDRRSGVEASFDRWETLISSDATTSAGALSDLDKQLDLLDFEHDTVRCALLFREDQVDLVKHGQLLSFRGAAAAILSPVTLRVASLSWEEAGPGFYLAHLELAFPTKIAARTTSSGGLPTSGTPPPSTLPYGCLPDSTSLVFEWYGQTASGYVHGPPSGVGLTGDGSVYELYLSSGVDTQWITQATQVCYPDFVPDPPTLMSVHGAPGGMTVQFWEAGAPATGYPPPTTDGSGILAAPVRLVAEVGLSCVTTPFFDGHYWTCHAQVIDYPLSLSTVRDNLAVTAVAPNADDIVIFPSACEFAGSFRLLGTTTDPAADPRPLCSTGTPLSGQWVLDENVGASDGTSAPPKPTDHAYAAGSLRVFVDDIYYRDGYVEDDPATGTWHFTTIPPVGRWIMVEYQGA